MQYRTRLLLGFGALLFCMVHILSEHLGGGVKSHHLLNRPDLPAISNWYGLFVLPTLAWILGVRLRTNASPSGSTMTTRTKNVVAVLLIAALYGSVLAASFEFGHEAVTSGLALGLLALAVVFPIYRAECILGFVAGMTFTFGAVLPTIFAGVLALISLLLHPLLRVLFRVIARLSSRLLRSSSGAA